MKKTKVVCTMGPNTNNPEIMRGLVKNGMNVARFNFSHGDYEEHNGLIKADSRRGTCKCCNFT